MASKMHRVIIYFNHDYALQLTTVNFNLDGSLVC